MASTKAQEKASKKYYDSNKKYRENKIAKTAKKHKENKPKYAKKYRKEEPIKSRAVKDRPKSRTRRTTKD